MVDKYYSRKNRKPDFFSSIKKRTKKYQISDSLKTRKQIYIYSDNGFGNKIFSLICAIYLYNYYNGKCDINYIPALVNSVQWNPFASTSAPVF